MSKYIDLADRIYDSDLDVFLSEIREVLIWLDRNPDQAPGRTITRSEFNKVMDEGSSEEDIAARLGVTVVPDPELTNAEKLERLWVEWAKLPSYDDTKFTDYLDAHGVKADG